MFAEFERSHVLAVGTGLSSDLAYKLLAWFRSSKTEPDQWIWRDLLQVAPDLHRLDPPLLQTVCLGKCEQRVSNQRGSDASFGIDGSDHCELFDKQRISGMWWTHAGQGIAACAQQVDWSWS